MKLTWKTDRVSLLESGENQTGRFKIGIAESKYAESPYLNFVLPVLFIISRLIIKTIVVSVCFFLHSLLFQKP